MDYTKGTIEFLTITTEICRFIEQISEGKTDIEAKDFVDKSVKLLPLLYLKAAMIEPPKRLFEDEPDTFVTEEMYREIQENIAELLGENDSYLTSFHADMPLSDSAIAAFISEDFADIYQDIKDFVFRCNFGDEQIMNDALAICIENFANYWGGKLLNALCALHRLCFNE
jgi:hypothetical protein